MQSSPIDNATVDIVPMQLTPIDDAAMEIEPKQLTPIFDDGAESVVDDSEIEFGDFQECITLTGLTGSYMYRKHRPEIVTDLEKRMKHIVLEHSVLEIVPLD